METNASSTTDTIKISIATTPDEKREIFRLRYNIYAEEISYNLISVDHRNKLLFDELDEWAILISAHAGSNLIGTVRVNIEQLSNFSTDLIETYRMDKFRKFFSETDDPYFAVISKIMISDQYRSSPAMYLLMAKCYDLVSDHHLPFVFVNCNFHLIPFYEHSGHVRIGKNILDPNLGPMASLVIIPDDVQHLRKVGSPLFRTARKRTGLDNKPTAWFYSEFSQEVNSTVHSSLVSAETLWMIISQSLEDIPQNFIPILKDLSVDEAKLFLHSCSTIVHCHAGDAITDNGNASQELIILLSGLAKSSHDATIFPGQYCGNNGLVQRSRHSSSIIAIEDSNILVLSYYYFNSFRKRHPNIAGKILNNL